MKNIMTILKKEWDRVMKDKRLIFTVIILPGLMLFLIYSFIGNAVENIGNGADVNVAIVNNQQGFIDIYDKDKNFDSWNIIDITPDQVASYEQQVDDKTWTMVIIFAPDFATYDGTGTAPQVSYYSNGNDLSSSTIANTFVSYLSYYQSTLAKQYFTIEKGGTPVSQNVAIGQALSTLLPMFVVMFLFAGAMSVGPESIAGEKERGTIATLLVTPVKRSQIALGKVMSLSLLSLLSAISSFIGISLSLTKLLNIGSSSSQTFAIYSVGDYFMILGLLITTVLVIVGLISIISAYARTVKEATSLVLPLYIVTILTAVSTMFSGGASSNWYMYLIPIYNTVQTMISILTFDTAALGHLLITMAANLVYVTIFVYLLNRMFQSEKIMFKK